jgi:hypothetical protein
MFTTSNKLTKQCKTCLKTFSKGYNVSNKNWEERSIYCSKSCINKGRVSFRKGKPLGYEVWNKGKKGLQAAWNKGIAHESILNEKNHLWKGDKASLIAKHTWVVRRLGKPQHCEHCKTKEKRMYHWANISGKYKRDLTDWKRLCVPCHKRYDLGKLGTSNLDITY